MRFSIVFVMIFMSMRCRFIFMAALVMITMTMVEGGDLCDAVTVTKIATHDAKHLRPTQREKR